MNERPTPRLLRPVRPVLVARRGAAWAADYAWIGAAQARAVLRRLRPGDLATGHLAPVLLLPGIYETWEVMQPLALVLHEAGHPVHPVPGLGWNHASLAHSARQVTAQIEALGLPHVLLVAHSKGGLIGKLVMASPEAHHGHVAGLVAINTPFAGSVYARWFPTRSVRALSPRDPHVLALAGHSHVHPRVVSVYAQFDPHVPSGSHLPGATNIEVPVDGHFRVLADPRVHRAVLDSLADLTPHADAGSSPGAGATA
ncbi:esterase/lipase family protein [Cellulomonas soli]|uniref:esterase/lipase family protein n=1 Tax=Cellulomonas soli TaxID=931535 RepID=UPI003F87E23C